MKHLVLTVALIFVSSVVLAETYGSERKATLSTQCAPTGKYFKAYGVEYDYSVLHEFHQSYGCHPAKGGMGGFELNVEGCNLKNVRLSVENYVPGFGYDGYYLDFEITGKTWAKIRSGTGELKTNAGKDTILIQGTGANDILSITRTSNGSSEVLNCRALEGDG